MHQWQEICALTWRLLVVCVSLSITSGLIGFAYGNSTLEDNGPAAPARVLACGSRLKFEIKSICMSNRDNSQGAAYYSPEVPQILIPKTKGKRERNASSSGRREGNLLRKIVNRVPRGVIEECCRKPCDRQNLLKYCASFDKIQTTEASSTPLQSQSTETSEQVESNSGRVRNESVILPRLIQLLWDRESSEKPANILNYHPQKLLKIVKTRSHKQNCSRGRGISARDIDRNRLTNSNIFSRSRHSMASDETRRDSQVSDENKSDFVISYYNSSPLETLAATVTDEPLLQVFPIPAGTNVDYAD